MHAVLSFSKSDCQEQMKQVKGFRLKTELSWRPPVYTYGVYSVNALLRPSQMNPFYTFCVPLPELVWFCHQWPPLMNLLQQIATLPNAEITTFGSP